MSVKIAKVQFNGGELSPLLEGRIDIAKYDKTARLCRNFIPLAEGSLRRRGGTHFVAETPVEERVLFKIVSDPLDAVVLINNEEQREFYVSRGDTVSFEVRAEGYETKIGEMVISQDTEIEVRLISNIRRCRLVIEPDPSDAVVKINGYTRTSADIAYNEVASYRVYHDGYVLAHGEVLMDNDKTISVVLEPQEDVSGEGFGNWGTLERFVACSAVGSEDKRWKCFYIKFSNGYLPVIFDANKEKPEGNFDSSLFFESLYDGYNSVVYKNNAYRHTIVEDRGDYICWLDKDRNIVWAMTMVDCMVLGWQVDEQGRYATIYKSYDGVVSDNVLHVYHNGQLVWTLKGKNNG